MAKAKKRTAKRNPKTTVARKQKADARKSRELTQKAKHTTTLTTLRPIAKEINVRIDKAEGMDTKADDHRLAASLKLAEAKKLCEKDGIKFKKWCEDNLNQSYDNLRKLAMIGATTNPAKALMDMRAGNKIANKKHRESVKGKAIASAPAEERVTPFQQASKALEALEDRSAINLMASVAKTRGMAIVSETDLEDLKYIRAQKASQPKIKVGKLSAAQNLFDELSARDQMALVEYSAKKVGVTIEKPHYGDIPKNLQRTVKRGVKK